jgi:hypothetical protein
LFISPYFVALPFLVFGYDYQRSFKVNAAPFFWLAALLALNVYAVFNESASSAGFWIRTPNFLWVPLSILSAVGIFWVHNRTKSLHLRKIVKPAVAAIVIVMVAVNVYALYGAVSLQDRYMGYQWVYSNQEFKAGAWINGTSINQTIAGDVKAAYILHDYFDVSVDTGEGFRYLVEDGTSPPSILYTYRVMQQNGYLIGIHGVDLPENWTEKMAPMNFVYSNGFANVYAGVKPTI